jgi:hypothetical protein
MKRLSIFITLFMLFGVASAQTSGEEIDYIQAMFGMEKRAAVKDFITLQDSEKDSFWKYYDEYEAKRKVYGKERIILLDKFVDKFDTMSDQESDAWMKSVLSLRDKNEKLIEAYYKKIRKTCSASVAMKFYQIESYILAGIRFQILENVPF